MKIETMVDSHDSDKRRELFDQQVELLNTFLEHGAISQAQYDKSFGDLAEKMGYKENKGGEQ